MGKKRIIILGAGLAGLSAAWHLQKKGIDCLVFEKESQVGGLCRSKEIEGFTFDFTGHLLHFKQDYTFNLVKSLLGENLVRHQRSAWVYSYGAYSRYPFQANLYGLPSSIARDCLLGFIEKNRNHKKGINKNSSFLDWIDQTFGKGIAKHFMIPYNKKFWTISPSEMTCEWLDGFIPVPSLTEVVEGTVDESKRQFGYNAWFWYPKRGSINQLPLSLANSIKNIYTDTKITEVDIDKKEIKMVSGNKEKFDYLISTIPLPEMAHLIKNLPSQIRNSFKDLKWNSIFNLNLGIEKNDSTGRHWVYFPQKDACFFRLGFFHNFSSYLAPSNKSSLYVEVSYSKDKLIDKNKIILRIKEDLKKIGILNQGDRICAQDINDIRYGYPIYDSNYSQAREKILKYLNCKNILSCGRYGSWRYLSMEDTILDAKATADIL